MKKSISIILFATIAWVMPAFAEDEMTTETKPGTVVPGAPPTAKAPSAEEKATAGKKLDPALRARIRRRAPFWIADASHGAAIRINKDGTFSSESGGGGSIAGTWKAFRGEIWISWSDGGEQYGYSIQSGKGGLTVQGKSAVKNRFTLSGL